MKICKRVCAFLLALLGVSVYARDFPRHVKNVEGFELEDSETCVYGGRRNYINTRLFGNVTFSDSGDEKDSKPCPGMTVLLYSGTSELGRVSTDETGRFLFAETSVWAGVSVKYTVIVSDPNGKFEPVRRDFTFDIDEIVREENFSLELKKSK